MTKIKNHYKTLDVSPTATAREVLRARNRLLKIYHPDLNPGLPDAKEKTIEIVLAAEVLLDDDSRAQYDRIYNNVFRPAEGKKARPPRPSPPKPSPAPDTGTESETIVCRNCGRKNVRPKRHYCMYCGAGIGDAPRDFSLDDILNEVLKSFHEREAARKTPKPPSMKARRRKIAAAGAVFTIAVLAAAAGAWLFLSWGNLVGGEGEMIGRGGTGAGAITGKIAKIRIQLKNGPDSPINSSPKVYVYPASTPLELLVPNGTAPHGAANSDGYFTIARAPAGEVILVVDYNSDGNSDERKYGAFVREGRIARLGVIDGVRSSFQETAPPRDGTMKPRKTFHVPNAYATMAGAIALILLGLFAAAYFMNR